MEKFEGIEDALANMPGDLRVFSVDYYPDHGECITVFVHPRSPADVCYRGGGGTFKEAYAAALAEWRAPVPDDVLVSAFSDAVDQLRRQTGAA